jgi:hypothetical protein
MGELLETVFPLRSVLKSYNEDQSWVSRWARKISFVARSSYRSRLKNWQRWKKMRRYQVSYERTLLHSSCIVSHCSLFSSLDRIPDIITNTPQIVLFPHVRLTYCSVHDASVVHPASYPAGRETEVSRRPLTPCNIAVKNLLHVSWRAT